jgi:hypothetical protein
MCAKGTFLRGIRTAGNSIDAGSSRTSSHAGIIEVRREGFTGVGE